MKRQAYQLRSTQQLDRGKLFLKGFKKIVDIVSPANPDQFNIVQTLPINPGLETTFGWAAGMAANYEMYDLLKCKWYFRTMTANALSSTPALGTIIMATQYNSLSPAYADKKQMENAYGCSSGIISTDRVHYVQVNGGTLENQFVRTEAAVAGTDLRVSDVGVTFIALSGLPAALAQGTVIGELWCSYKMILMKEKQNTSLTVQDEGYVATSLPATAAGNLYCGPAKIIPYTGSTSIVRRSTTSPYTAWIFPNTGRFFVLFRWSNAGTMNAPVTWPTLAPASNADGALVPMWDTAANITVQNIPEAGSDATALNYVCTFQVIDVIKQNGVFNIAGTFTANLDQTSFQICVLPFPKQIIATPWS